MSATEKVQTSPQDSTAPASALGPATGHASLARVQLLLASPASDGEALAVALESVGPSREAATFLVRGLEEKVFGERQDADGMPLRLVAVDALIEMGFPYALEVPPEELAALRDYEQSRRGTARSLVFGALWGASALAAQLARLPPPFEWFSLGAISLGALGLVAVAARPESRRALNLARATLAASVLGSAVSLGALTPAAIGNLTGHLSSLFFAVHWVFVMMSVVGLWRVERRARRLSNRRKLTVASGTRAGPAAPHP